MRKFICFFICFFIYLAITVYTFYSGKFQLRLTMLIKHKLIFNTSILVAALVLMLMLLNYSVGALEGNIDIARTIGKIDTQVLQLRRNEKDFLARKDLKYVKSFQGNVSALKANLTTLSNAIDDSTHVRNMQKVIGEYEKHFLAVVEKQKTIGLHPKDGLYGQLRDTVHHVEEIIGDKDYYLLSDMLQLRRNEKDFMLRLDEKYVSRLQNNAQMMIQDVRNSSLTSTLKEQIIDGVTNYQRQFELLVKAQIELGLSSSEGLLGVMRKTVHQVDDISERLNKSTKEGVEDHVIFVDIVSYTLAFVVLVVAVFAAVWTSRGILNSINQLKDTMLNLSLIHI